jgi:hypothetical protein
LTLVVLTANFTSPAIALNVTTEFIKFHPTISAAGWGGYVTASNSSFTLTFAAPNISWADTNTTFLPFAQYVTEATGGIAEVLTVPFNSYFEFFQKNIVGMIVLDKPGVPQLEIASRLLPISLAETDPAKAAKIILSLGASMK